MGVAKPIDPQLDQYQCRASFIGAWLHSGWLQKWVKSAETPQVTSFSVLPDIQKAGSGVHLDACAMLARFNGIELTHFADDKSLTKLKIHGRVDFVQSRKTHVGRYIKHAMRPT